MLIFCQEVLLCITNVGDSKRRYEIYKYLRKIDQNYYKAWKKVITIEDITDILSKHVIETSK